MRGGCEECRDNRGKGGGVIYQGGNGGDRRGRGKKKKNSPMKICGGEEKAVHRNRLEENDAIT